MNRHVLIFLCFALVGLPAGAFESMDAILNGLTDPDYEVQQEARNALLSAVAAATAPGAEDGLADELEGRLSRGLFNDSLPLPRRVLQLRMLGLLGSPASAGALYKLAATPDEPELLRANAVKALSMIPGDVATSYVLEGLRRAGPKDRHAWWESLNYRQDPGASAGILELLKQGAVPLNEVAASTLGSLADAEIAAWLAGQWEELDAELQTRLAFGLVYSGQAEAGMLDQLAWDSGPPALRAAAFKSLILKDFSRARSAYEAVLEEAGKGDRPNWIRIALVDGDPVFWTLTTNRMDSLSSPEKQVVLAAMADLGKSEHEPLVIGMLDSEDPATVKAAIRCLGFIGGDLAATALLDLSGARADPDLADVLSEALSRLKAPALDATMMARAAELDDPAHLQAIEILALRNTPGATDLLNDLLLHPGLREDTREVLLDALVAIGDVRSARQLILALLTEADPLRMRQIQVALRQMTLRMEIPDRLWESVYAPALQLASTPELQARVVVLLDGISNESALEYCMQILDTDMGSDLADSALSAMTRWRQFNIGADWVDVIDSEDTPEALRQTAMRGLRRLLLAEYVPGNDGDKGKRLAGLFLRAESGALRDMMVSVAEDQGGWFLSSFYWELYPILQLSDYRERLEAMVEP